MNKIENFIHGGGLGVWGFGGLGCSMKKFLFLLGMIFVMSGVFAYSNPSSNWQANQPTFDDLYAGDFENYWPILSGMKDGQCNATTDFVIGIPPGGCSPSVVTSDLLAEQNVPVFCQLYAIKVNPLIKVSAIKSISFKGDYPEGVRSVVFHPARAAVKSYSTLLGSPTLENIGYVVIILKQDKVEANMTEWIFGNLTATMTYDAEEAYGTGSGDYYLEPMGENEWQQNYMASSFWNGRGYLRVLDVENGVARIQVMGSKDNVLRTLTLKEGETSSSSYLPGFYCKAGLKVKLTDITTQEDMALLNVDGSNIWVRKGSKFLDGKCSVSKLVVRGNNDGEITISCSGAGKIAPLVLSGEGVMFKIVKGEAEEEVEVKVGGKVTQDYYLSYVGKYPKGFDEKERDIVILTKGISSVKKMTNIYAEVNKLADKKGSEADFTGVLEDWMKAQGVEGFILEKGQYENGVTFFGVSNVLEDESSDVYFEKSVLIVRDELVEDYGSEEKEIGGTWGEEALYEEIVLAGKIGNYMTQKKLMDLFLKRYPLAASASYVSDMRARMDGTDYSKSFVNVYVGDEFKSISVVDFKAASSGEKTVDLKVGPNFYSGLNESDNVSLGGDVGTVNILKIAPGRVNVRFYSKISKATGVDRSRTVWINEGSHENFAGVDFYVEEIRVNEVAHVTLIPDVKHDKSEADFTFRIGVEKRAIELSPERATEMIKNLNVSIAKWEGIVERLGNVVTGLKGACFATSAVLMIKNMATGVSGEAAARSKVMIEYKKKCALEHPDMTRTQCYNLLSKEIDADVVAMTGVLSGVNAKMEAAQKGNIGDSGGLFGGEGISNDTKYKEDLRKQIVGNPVIVNVGNEEIKVPTSSLYTTSQIRAVLTWEAARGKGSVESVAKSEMDDALRNVALAERASADKNKAVSNLVGKLGTGVTSMDVVTIVDKDTKVFQGSGKTVRDYSYLSGLGLKDSQKVQVATYGGEEYVLILGENDKNGVSGVAEVYQYNNSKWGKVAKPDFFNKVVFSGASDSKDCSNVWPKGTARVSYYESGDNKGLPAVVPFDLNSGWYAMVANSGGTFIDDSPQGYTASADVRYFKICNIGTNGLMQSGTGDDLCQSFDVNTVGEVKNFIPCPRISSGEVSRLYGKAREAIKQASQQYGKRGIGIFDEMIEVGAPMSEIGGFECQDFMSPSDCKLMFNVCDPVICPPSRCDFGGKFPVSDVIQTGIVGSLVLCLPNAKEGVFIPVCLSGVHAGLDAYLSILKSERECLTHSIETGEMIGICDQITSIYKCEFFWRQLSPLMDQMIPGVIEYAISGGRVRGGGEYALVEQSWNTMKQSVSYFKDVYAQNAFKAFNIRSTQEVGSSVCKAFVGTSVPGSASFIEDLLAPESPSQFYAQFSEKLFSGATVPSTSQYKVYYHIYAGKDAGVQYKVYLRDPPATSYYSSTPEVSVKSGYIAAGSSADESLDFTAPSGYKELCVVINAQEECGFKQVTTDFGLDYLSSKYVEEQATDTDITTEKQCISGNPSALSMATLNLQSGADEIISPEIAMRGIVRVCASTNPDAGVTTEDYVLCSGGSEVGGSGSSGCGVGFYCGASGYCESKSDVGIMQRHGSRWKDVGYCGEVNLRCWLDVDSVKSDLEKIEIFSGASIKMLDERRGLIDNARLDLEGVAALLSKARQDINKLAVSKSVGDGLKIVGELDRVIGNDSMSGAGTNGDRAEALSLKASVYRLLVGFKIKDAVDKVVEAREEVSEDDFVGVNVTGSEGEVLKVCDSYCKDEQGFDFGEVVGDEGESCVNRGGGYSDVEGGCCCLNEGEIPVDSGEIADSGLQEIKDYVAKWEGFSGSVYVIDGKKHIGVGHQLSSESRDLFSRAFDCNTQCFDDIIAGNRKLTEEEGRALFAYELDVHIKRTIVLFPEYNSYPVYVKKALVNAVYRGEMEVGQKTVDLINSGEWRKAAVEYINRVDYREAEAKGIGGIVDRMNENRDLFLRYAVELESGVSSVDDSAEEEEYFAEFDFVGDDAGKIYLSLEGCDLDVVGTAAVIAGGESCPLYEIYVSPLGDGTYDIMSREKEKTGFSRFFSFWPSKDVSLGKIDLSYSDSFLKDKSSDADEIFKEYGLSEESLLKGFSDSRSAEIKTEAISDSKLTEVVQAAIKEGILDKNCEKYIGSIKEVANKYSQFDALMLLSLMQQESTCNPDAKSGSNAYGLMQVASLDICKSIGVNSPLDVLGSSNSKTNIECGVMILDQKYKEKYKRYSCKEFYSKRQKQPEIDEVYYGVEYALRGYNGWSCARTLKDGREVYADHLFVEKVVDDYDSLREIAKEI
ncbi:transglycosylase SLT domain-containing protein [Candidatus Pacearchaeota archaeon]|nr:transglycosylase SLT domain-containing protein [Candidatus Pacearchaeota archaeon]